MEVQLHQPAFKPGDIVIANYSFTKDKNEDLSFSKNDKMKIINVARDPNWAHAKNTFGQTGLIPINYVELSPTIYLDQNKYIWYHGRINRAESERLLCGYPIGSFLIRDSDVYIGDLTLCVMGPPMDRTDQYCGAVDNPTPSNVQHYHILSKRANTDGLTDSITYSLDECDWFTKLEDLIKFYSLPENGLVCALTYPVPDLQRKRLDLLHKYGWTIAQRDLNLGDRIGRGEFSEVLKATYKGRPVAVKVFKKTACRESIIYEASLMTQLEHPNLVSFVGLAHDPTDALFYLVVEYLPNGNLLTYLHSRTRNEVGDKDKLHFAVDVCRGLAYLEERHVVHRDVAARNILLSGEPPRLIAKVADFGMARDMNGLTVFPSHIRRRQPDTAPPCLQSSTCPLSSNAQSFLSSSSSTPSWTVPSVSPSSSSSLDANALSRMSPTNLSHDNAAIPVKWTAPEAVRKRQFSTKSDVWSFGILLWEIYSYGRIPYPRMMASQTLKHIISGYRMKPPEGCPDPIYDLMRRTWHIEPDQRPPFSSMLRELIDRLEEVVRIENCGEAQFSVSSTTSRTGELNNNTLKSSSINGCSNKLDMKKPWGWTTDYVSDCYDQIEDFVDLPNSALNVNTAPKHSTMTRSFTQSTTSGLKIPTSVGLPTNFSSVVETLQPRNKCCSKSTS